MCKVDLVIVTIILYFIIFNVSGNNKKMKGLIYILEWTPPTREPLTFIEDGQKGFVTRKCAFQNCFITSNRNYFSDILHFDALLFNLLQLYEDMSLPPRRSHIQKYIFVGLEPAGYYPIPAEFFNGYFNLTWTYKLDSDILFPYIIIKNQNNEVIGPKTDMHWVDVTQMNKISTHIKNKLRYKHIAAAWIASNCETVDRLDYVHVLQTELAKYGHRVDVYGKCGDHQCPRQEAMDECYALIEQDYYFYLAFENSYSEDYVTEKLLHALEHYTVPVVLGGANYSRFVPKGIYLDAGRLGPQRLAKRMNDIMNDEEGYYDFFKWHGYYSFHGTNEDRYHREICGLCDLLNNKTRMKQTSIWHNLIQWWNVPFPATRPEWHLVLDDNDVAATGVQGIAMKLYNYVFES